MTDETDHKLKKLAIAISWLVTLLTLATAMLFVVGAFGAWSLDPANWVTAWRGFLAIVWCICMVFITGSWLDR